MLVEVALSYAASGWWVFPCHSINDGRCTCKRTGCSSPGKHPLTRSGLKEASRDRAVIAEWWERWPWANIALACGAVYVIDVDGEQGLAEWRRLIAEHGATPTMWTRTGGGGVHLFYEPPSPELRSTHWKLASHIDTRGLGGYVLLPPSLHASGARYQWGSDLPVAALPGWIHERVKSNRPEAKGVAVLRFGEQTRRGERMLARALSRIAAAPEGRRNVTLNEEAFLLGGYAAGGELDPRGLDALLESASTDPDRLKARRTIRRALRDGADYPITPERPLNGHLPSREPDHGSDPSPTLPDAENRSEGGG